MWFITSNQNEKKATFLLDVNEYKDNNFSM